MYPNQYRFSGAIVLDFDDTIAATRETRAKLLCEVALSHFGVHILEEKINANWGKPFDELLKYLMPNVNEREFSNIYADAMRKYPPKILPGVQDIFQEAYNNHIAILILSSGSNKLVSQDIEIAKLSNFVLKLWGHEDTTQHKPDPRVLDPLLAFSISLGISKNTLLYIGDSTSDYHIAKRNGVLFIATLTGSQTEQDFLLAGLPQEYIVKDLSLIKLGHHTISVRNKKVLSLSDK